MPIGSLPINTTFTTYGIQDFTVQGWNGSSWVTLGTVTNNNLVKRTVTFAAYTTLTRIRITAALASFSRNHPDRSLGKLGRAKAESRVQNKTPR